MNKETIIFAIVFTCLSIGGASAQVNKEVEVTRAYIPEVAESNKLPLMPDMSDDTYIQPDIDYSITPISIETEFESEIYRPVSIALDEYDPSKRYYAKGGIGLPFRSVVDLYATPINNSLGYVMGYFNQEGSYSDIKNDFGEKYNSSNEEYRVGAAAGRYYDRRSLEGDVNYNCERWSRYATNANSDREPNYQSVNFVGRYGDRFVDMQRWNYAVEGEASYFWSRSDIDNTMFGVRGDVGRQLFGGELIIGGGYNVVSGSDSYCNNSFDVGANYRYVTGDWSFDVAIKYLNDRVEYNSDDAEYVAVAADNTPYKGPTSHYFLPDVDVSYGLYGEQAIVYGCLTSELLHYNYATLSEVNPYIAPGLFASHNGVEYDFDFGLKGRFKERRFGYNLYVGYTVTQNNLYWAFIEQGMADDVVDNYFLASYSLQNCLSFNFEMEYMPMSNLLFGFDFAVNSYSHDKDQVLEGGMPSTVFGFDARYSAGAWRFGLDFDVASQRMCSVINTNDVMSSVEIPLGLDLAFNVDYRLKNGMVLFAEIDNILNSDLYKFVRYRELGVGGVLGVKMEF